MRNVDSELDALETAYGEVWGEVPAETLEAGETFEAGEAGRAFDEIQESELASALMEIASEEELDRFLGSLIRRAGRAVGRVVRSPVGQQLGGILKGAARQVLPVLGGAIGSALGGPSGGTMGGQAASTIGQVFGLEVEGLSQEDQEYEIARRFVRFGGAAAANAAQAPATASPAATATAAATAAARRHAPGLLRGRRGRSGPRDGATRQGRWIRRGRNIIIVNCGSPAQTETP
jgi:hypothetical protein